MKKVIILVLVLFAFSTSLFGCSKCEHVCENKSTIVKESTCTERGIAEFKCKNCEEPFLVELEFKEHSFIVANDGEKQICEHCGKTKSVPHQHPIIAVKATTATCGDNGMNAHYFCEYCLKYFTDEEGREEVPRSAIIVPATGNHVPGPDNFYCFDQGTGKWMHDIRCNVCQVGINLDPIDCPQCHGEELNIVGNTATCRKLTCGH